MEILIINDSNKQQKTISEDDAPHIFQDKDGHMKNDTPKNRKILEDVANNEDNYLCKDKWGK